MVWGERIGDGFERGGLVGSRDGVEDGATEAAVGEVVGGVGWVVAEAEVTVMAWLSTAVQPARCGA